MRYLYYALITLLSLFFSPLAYAFDFYAQGLYWRPSESIDWALTNSNISATLLPNQDLSYKTIDFDFAPGFRVGAGFQLKDWDIRLLYTRFNTQTQEGTYGNVISTFMPSKFNTKFYQSAQVDFSIHFSMFDLILAKPIQVSDSFLFTPSLGLRGGRINQQINTKYQFPIDTPLLNFNPYNVLEKVSNDFSGLGPTAGARGQWYFYHHNTLRYSLVGDLSAAYLWGTWAIHDTLFQQGGQAIGGLSVGDRDLGAFAIQALFGIEMAYKQCAILAGYEVSDWFNQYQVFDNGSGAHTNDLVFQGLTLAFQYHF